MNEKLQTKEHPVDQIRQIIGLDQNVPIKVQFGSNEKIHFNSIGDPKKHVDVLSQDTVQNIATQLYKPQALEKGSGGKRAMIKITAETEGKVVELFRQEKNGGVSVKTFDAEGRESAQQFEKVFEQDQAIPQKKESSVSAQPIAIENFGPKQEATKRFTQALDSAIKKVEAPPPVKRLLRKFEADFRQQAGKAVEAIKGKVADFAQDPKGRTLAAAEKAAVGTGKGIQVLGQSITKAGQAVVRVGNWLAERPSKIRNFEAAKSVVKIFEKGDARIPQDEYSLDNGQFVSREKTADGTKYYISEAEVHKDDAKPALTFTVDSGGKISGIQQQNSYSFESLKESSKADIIKAAPDLERRHAEASKAVASAVNSILDLKGVDQDKGKNYQFSREADTVKITASGRGDILRVQGNTVESKLNREDFNRFAPVVEKMQTHVRDRESVR